MENWTTIPGSNNRYEITKNGDVRRKLSTVINNRKGSVRRVGGKTLSQKTKSNGYKELSLAYENQKSKMEYVHRLVVRTFIGEIPKNYEVNHIDGDKSNNRVENLEIVTPSENRLHSFRVLGNKIISPKGENHNNASFKNKDILEIRDLYSKGIMPKEISTIYNRPYSTICKICYRITWKHI